MLNARQRTRRASSVVAAINARAALCPVSAGVCVGYRTAGFASAGRGKRTVHSSTCAVLLSDGTALRNRRALQRNAWRDHLNMVRGRYIAAAVDGTLY
jgi:hypothetical protein